MEDVGALIKGEWTWEEFGKRGLVSGPNNGNNNGQSTLVSKKCT
jgi:hypothetical protein